MASIVNFSGNSNRGTQVGINSGYIINSYDQRENSPIKPSPSSTVPFRQDPDFIDRDILAQVDKICSEPAARAALVGLGGVGKSQLAIESSYRVREQNPQMWVFWVHASNAARFEESYRIIADKVKLPLNRDESTADILQLVSKWLRDEENGRWIMILDNADDTTVFSDPRKGGAASEAGAAVSLSSFLPQTPNGSILVTSRSGEAALRLTGRHRDIIRVQPMDEDCALLLLERKLPDEIGKDDAKELLRVLDYMPLAISQAAAYISQGAPRTTVASYLATFRESDENQTNLLNKDIGDLRRDNSASNSIITTWQISFEHISDKRPSATRLLSLMSFFDRQGIPELLLYDYDDGEDSSDIEFDDDLVTLANYSLIKVNVDNNHFEMHRLVQFSTRKWLELNGELEKWTEKYTVVLLKAFPFGEFENWKTCRELFAHAKAALACRPKEMNYRLAWCDLLGNAGQYANSQGNFLTAEVMHRRALEEKMKMLGEEHLETLGSISNLAAVLKSQGKYEVAEEMIRRVLTGKEKTLGKGHPNTLVNINNLASVLEAQGKHEAAEKMIRRAVDGAEKAMGKEQPNTLTSVGILAMVLNSQGKYEAAEEMTCRVLSGEEKALGMEHPNTLATVNNMASMLEAQGKYEAAEKMIRRAVDGAETVLGKEHPNTLTSVGMLAMVLESQGKYEAAEEMTRRALSGKEKALGMEHPDTLKSVGNLAMILKSHGKYETAENINRRALDGYEKTLGNEHPDTLKSLYSWRRCCRTRGYFRMQKHCTRDFAPIFRGYLEPTIAIH